jgi:hypothetical protein
MLLKNLRFLPFLLLAAGSTLGEEELIEAHLTFFNPFTDTRGVFFTDSRGEQEILASFNGLSARYRFVGESPVILYRKSGEGEFERRDIVGELNLDPRFVSYIVFLRPINVGDPNSRYAMVPFPETVESTARNANFVYNMSQVEIAIQLGEVVRRIGPLQTLTIDNSLFLDSEQSPVTISRVPDTRVRFGVNIEDDWKIFYRRIWRIRPDQSQRIFVVPMGGASLRVFQFTEG